MTTCPSHQEHAFSAAAEARPGLLVVGPFRGVSGYDRHTRELVRQLVALGVPVELLDLPGWSRPAPAARREAWFDQLSRPVEARTALHFTLPTQVRRRPDKRNVNFTMFEADCIPATWAESAAQCELVVVPTPSSADAWLAAGIPAEKLRVAPLGVDATFFSAQASPFSLQICGRPLHSYRHRFLSVAELIPRKNHLGLLRAWLRATAPRDDAVLIVKSHAVDAQLRTAFAQDISEMTKRCGLRPESAAPIVFLFDTLSDEDLRALYQACTHYVSLSLGEGWDLPMLEAAAAGCRLIAPRHSAYLSYLTEDDAELLPVSSEPVAFEGRLRPEDAVWFEGAHWWRPDEDAAVAVLRGIIDGHAPVKPAPQARIAAGHDWRRAALALLDALALRA